MIAKQLESDALENGILVSDVVKQPAAGETLAFLDQEEIALKGFEEPS